ncbi:MAG TPA: putative Ig domain-containing protein [Pseudonocardiaceae bacterium]|nr:putative Ig domain-containing protein [Pseudonocardiaceae bacterium]
MRYGAVLVATMLGAMFAVAAGATANAGTPQQLNLRILLLGDGSGDPTTAAWQSTLDSEGVPYTLATASGSYGSETVTLPTLSSGTVGNFNGVVIADSPYAFGAGQLDSLFSYEAAFGVRQVDGYIYPAPQLGLTAASGGAQDGTTDTLSAAALAAMPQLKGPVPMDTGTYGYPATTTSGAPVTPWLTNSANQVLAAVYQHPGTDPQANVAELALTFDYNASSLQWLLLGPGLVDWVTQNTHLGLYRNYYGQDVDDVMIADNEWSRQYQCTPAATDPVDVGCPTAVQGNAADGPPDSLMSPTDVAYVANWEQQTGIKLEMAFNAAGACTEPSATDTSNAKCTGNVSINGTTYTDPGVTVDDTAPNSSGLINALLADQGDFNWITHTWSHLYLGCMVWQAPATNPATVSGGGSIAAGNYTYEVTAATAYGESEPSAAIPVTVGASGSASLSWPDATNGGGGSLSTLESEFSGGTGFWGYKVYRENPGSSTFGLVGQVAENPAGGTATYGFTDSGATAPGTTPDTDSSYPTATNPGIECAGSGGNDWTPASATDPTTSIEGQIGLDVAFAQANGLTNYDPTAVVTGEHSGLESPNMPAAMNGAAIKTFGSDASRQPNSYTIGGASSAPRYPSNIYYNASNWANQLSEYNTLYVNPDTSIGDSTYPSENGRCVATSATTCLSAPATEASLLASESHIMLGHVLGNNPRMSYAHQSDLIGPAQQGGADYGYTLISLINDMLAQYNNWYTVPLSQVTDTTSAQALARQSGWAATETANTVSASVTNGVVTVTNSGTGSASVPVTVPAGTTVNGSAFGQAYGGTLSDWTTLGGSATQTLTEVVAPAITSAASANSIVGAAFSDTISTTGAPTPALTETGALPSGVTFTDNGNGTATLAGTPAAGSGGSYPITLTATSSSGIATQSFTLTNSEAPAITSPATSSFTVGSAGTYTVTTTGYPAATITESGALPSGLTFTGNGNGTATIAGTPAAGTAGSYPVTLSATNSSGSTATLGLTITVTAAAGPAITSGASAFFTNGSAGAFAITTTGSPTPAITETGALPPGLTFTDEGNGNALLQGTPTGTGTTNLTITATNTGGTATQSLSVVVGQAPAITSASTSSFGTGAAGSFSVTTTGYPAPAIGESGILPSGLSFVDKNDGTATISGTPAAGSAGSYPVTLTATNGTGSVNQTLTITVTDPTGPAITSAGTAGFASGKAGSFTVTTTGSPAPALTETGALPAGLTFTDNGNGNGTATIAGTPTAGGTGNVTVTATSTAGTASQALSITVSQAPAITSAATAPFSTGTAGSFSVTTTGYPAAAITETGALPSGLSFVDNKDGTASIAGTPAATAGGSYPLTVTATSSAGTVSQALTVTVSSGPAFTTAGTAGFVLGTTGSFTVRTTGSPAAGLTETGKLPAGLTFTDQHNGTAVLSGRPTANGTTNLTVTATNLAGTATQALSVVVGSVPGFSSAGSATFSTGTAGNFTVRTTGSPAAALTETGALPAGLTFTDNHNGTATLAGTPTTGGKSALTITANNGVGSKTQTLTVTVNQAPKITSAATLSATRGKAAGFTVTTTGYPAPTIGISAGLLPLGMRLTGNGNGTATLSGTPLLSGTYRFTIRAANAAGSTTQAFTLTVGTTTNGGNGAPTPVRPGPIHGPRLPI